jgi:hypothetical protein
VNTGSDHEPSSFKDLTIAHTLRFNDDIGNGDLSLWLKTHSKAQEVDSQFESLIKDLNLGGKFEFGNALPYGSNLYFNSCNLYWLNHLDDLNHMFKVNTMSNLD